MSVLEIIFWTCVVLVVYCYALYPIIIWVLSRLFGRTAPPPEMTDADLPSMTLLIAAYNEEAVIAARVENALAMDYPREKLRILIASDGSSDKTAEIIARYADRGVRVLDYRERRGKAGTLNAAMAEVETELVLLSDANTNFEPAAARKMASWFADPNLGVVCGKLVLVDPGTGRNADGAYWKYETFLKKCDGRLGALLGSNGAIYAMRRGLFKPIPPDTIVDDFVIPLLAKLSADFSIVYDSGSAASEETAADVGDEFHRRARIGAGGFQAITLLWKLLDVRRGWIAFTFFSHKVLRWLCPFFLMGMLLSDFLARYHPIYRYASRAQFAFYLVSLLVTMLPREQGIWRPLRLATMFTSMNLAILVGFWRWVRGAQKGAWTRTARLAELGGSYGQPKGA